MATCTILLPSPLVPICLKGPGEDCLLQVLDVHDHSQLSPSLRKINENFFPSDATTVRTCKFVYFLIWTSSACFSHIVLGLVGEDLASGEGGVSPWKRMTMCLGFFLCLFKRVLQCFFLSFQSIGFRPCLSILQYTFSPRSSLTHLFMVLCGTPNLVVRPLTVLMPMTASTLSCIV